MKKILLALFTIVMLFCVASCSCEKEHTHRRQKNYKFDDTYHWYPCQEEGCEEKLEMAKHTFNEGVVTKAATDTKNGEKTFMCKVCKYSKVVPFSNDEVKTISRAQWDSVFSGVYFKNVSAEIVETIEAEGGTHKTVYTVQGNYNTIFLTIVKYIDGQEVEYLAKYQEGARVWTMNSRDMTIEDATYTYDPREEKSLATILKDYGFDYYSKYPSFVFNRDKYVSKSVSGYDTVFATFRGGKIETIEGIEEKNDTPARSVKITFSGYGTTTPFPPTKESK